MNREENHKKKKQKGSPFISDDKERESVLLWEIHWELGESIGNMMDSNSKLDGMGLVITIWNTLGTPKLRNPPTPKQKQLGLVGCMVTSFIDSQGFLSLSLGS
jgi:hypothetical protein